jgi:hypothetical protein
MNTTPLRVDRRADHQPTVREDDHMPKVRAAAGSMAHFVLQPGVVAGLVPWWLTGWRVRQPRPSWAWTPLRVAGAALLAAGAVVLVQAFVRFVVEGVGTPAPVAPTQRLVVGGPTGMSATRCIWRHRGHRRAGAGTRPARPAAVRHRRRRRHGRLRPRLRGTHPASPVRRPVRGLPAGRTGLVATPPPLATGPADQPTRHWTVITCRPSNAKGDGQR